MVSRKKFGRLYEQALAFLVCHYMKMLNIGDDTGTGTTQSQLGSIDNALRLSSYSEGGVSISWSVSSAGLKDIDSDFTLTTYGLQYLNLRRLVIVPITIRRPGFPYWGNCCRPPAPPEPPEPPKPPVGGTFLTDENGSVLTDENGAWLVLSDEGTPFKAITDERGSILTNEHGDWIVFSDDGTPIKVVTDENGNLVTDERNSVIVKD